MKLVQPINFLFKMLQDKSQVEISLFQSKTIIKGILTGFDEFMNLVLEEAEINGNKEGNLLLKGENVSMIGLSKL